MKIFPILWALPALVVLLAGVLYMAYQAPAAGKWSYSQLLHEADQGQVAQVVISGDTATAKTAGGSTNLVDLPPGDHQALASQLQRDHVDVRFQPPGPPSWTPLAVFAALALLPFAAWGAVLWAWPRTP